ncbi:MAG: bifunctional diaminohydroxyphosphoribosylaminopyrimidine deaminase/5-amino-6-(5-phosphoribosylamino)uracil reductase RibD [Chromatiales bacterium]|nr:bifunctional diaminohydroxyphosphoribosylaminopyrimidine deaminase/5-amino-6-(5-phosphoribosylamino)uracil reductase RibD [Gammaproteobacteria bacterium]
MSSGSDHDYMARAIRLAERGRYTTHPNPRVGCVLVKGDEIVGEGYHRRAGEPHAERNAIAMAGARAMGSTAYVTLEPCCHHGRTPPCTEGLIEAGVTRVVAAMEDPNPQVAGKGLAQLQQAGITAEVGLMRLQAEALNPGFIKRMRYGKPFVRCKLAMSLDGRTAMASGESKWITSSAARHDVHLLRARSSAILTGISTVLADDASMNVRLTSQELGLDGDLQTPHPVRVVLDPRLEMSPAAKMLALPGKTLVLGSDGYPQQIAALEAAGAEVVLLPPRDDVLDLTAVMAQLTARELHEVMLESGAVLAGAMLEQQLIDELVIYVAPHIMGDGARGLFHLPGLKKMEDRLELDITDLRQVGEEIRITARPLYRE